MNSQSPFSDEETVLVLVVNRASLHQSLSSGYGVYLHVHVWYMHVQHPLFKIW